MMQHFIERNPNPSILNCECKLQNTPETKAQLRA
jgi:hypothetical protein